MPALYLSAAHKSSGKTTLSIGLCAAMAQRGLSVQPFKKGPDYIDPHWLRLAAGRPCFNLDFYTQTIDEIVDLYNHRAFDADVSLIEGNKGLHDGLALDGSDSNAAMAKLLGAPVILVLDTRGATRGLAPLVQGYQAFDSSVNIGGVILNQLGGSRHESKIRAAIEHYTDVPVIGAVQKDPTLEIRERHLGLVPGYEDKNAARRLQILTQAIESQVDIERCLKLARKAPPVKLNVIIKPESLPEKKLRIGIAWDSAFGFYYQDDLLAFEELGAQLVKIDLTRETELPEIDGLFIGGGFPETQLEALESNLSMRESIAKAIVGGLPTYAECGGLMYLARSIEWKDQKGKMVGIIPADCKMHLKPQGKGYIELETTDSAPWPGMAHSTESIKGHEFHYSELMNLDKNLDYAFKVKRGTGIANGFDGFIYKNLLACYSHQRNVTRNPWVSRFIDFVGQTVESKNQNTNKDEES